MDTGDLALLDELEALQAARESAESQSQEVATLEQNAIHKSGDMRLMNNTEVSYSVANERRLTGEPDEVIEVETPEWLKNDPDFAPKVDPNAMRLIETNLEMQQSIDSQRGIESRAQKGAEYIEVSAPEGSMDEEPEMVQSPLSHEVTGMTYSEEQERIKKVLGPGNAPKRTPQADVVEPQGFFSRIRSWFGEK